MKLSKTIYLSYRDCAHNAWVRVHRPDIYDAHPLSEFDRALMETGRDVDELARNLFPGGLLIERGDIAGTAACVAQGAPVLYQPVFETDRYSTACDILRWNDETGAYDLFEVKSSTSNAKNDREELYTYDLGFQIEVLELCGVRVGRCFIVRLRSTYERGGELDVEELFAVEDFTERVAAVRGIASHEMACAYTVLAADRQPRDPCECMYRGRSAHCTTFAHTNPEVPAYSIHDIARIGTSRTKLVELVDRSIFAVSEVPEDFPLTEIQRNQVRAAQSGGTAINPLAIAAFLARAAFPIAFLDYETYPCAIPRFRGYRPFDQIPFQFSLDILRQPDGSLEHHEFLYTDLECPDAAFIAALDRVLPPDGSVAVWSAQFEKGINDALAARNPDAAGFLASINDRVVDLIDIFAEQAYVHPEFRGRTSIKAILPALVPALSYDRLTIQDGAAACETWNRLVTGRVEEAAKAQTIADLLVYCGQDTRAMFEIWNVLSSASAAAQR
jgi:hypothetical protein